MITNDDLISLRRVLTRLHAARNHKSHLDARSANNDLLSARLVPVVNNYFYKRFPQRTPDLTSAFIAWLQTESLAEYPKGPAICHAMPIPCYVTVYNWLDILALLQTSFNQAAPTLLPTIRNILFDDLGTPGMPIIKAFCAVDGHVVSRLLLRKCVRAPALHALITEIVTICKRTSLNGNKLHANQGFANRLRKSIVSVTENDESMDHNVDNESLDETASSMLSDSNRSSKNERLMRTAVDGLREPNFKTLKVSEFRDKSNQAASTTDVILKRLGNQGNQVASDAQVQEDRLSSSAFGVDVSISSASSSSQKFSAQKSREVSSEASESRRATLLPYANRNRVSVNGFRGSVLHASDKASSATRKSIAQIDPSSVSSEKQPVKPDHIISAECQRCLCQIAANAEQLGSAEHRHLIDAVVALTASPNLSPAEAHETARALFMLLKGTLGIEASATAVSQPSGYETTGYNFDAAFNCLRSLRKKQSRPPMVQDFNTDIGLFDDLKWISIADSPVAVSALQGLLLLMTNHAIPDASGSQQHAFTADLQTRIAHACLHPSSSSPSCGPRVYTAQCSAAVAPYTCGAQPPVYSPMAVAVHAFLSELGLPKLLTTVLEDAYTVDTIEPAMRMCQIFASQHLLAHTLLGVTTDEIISHLRVIELRGASLAVAGDTAQGKPSVSREGTSSAPSRVGSASKSRAPSRKKVTPTASGGGSGAKSKRAADKNAKDATFEFPPGELDANERVRVEAARLLQVVQTHRHSAQLSIQRNARATFWGVCHNVRSRTVCLIAENILRDSPWERVLGHS